MIYKDILLLLYCIMQNLAWSNGVKAVRSSKQDNPALKNPMDEKKEDQSIEGNAQNMQMTDVGIQQNSQQGVQEFNQQYFLPNKVETPEIDRNFDNDEILSYEQVKGDYSLTRNTYRKASNRRESSDAKLSERHMVSRACGNPFLSHLNYTDQLITQEQFLIPKNSNMENDYQQ